VISVEEWAEIRRLARAEQMPIKAIARTLGISKNTVRRALRSGTPPRYERQGSGSIVDAVEPRIRLLLQDHPRMPATVIAERIGWTNSITVLRDRVRELRPTYLPVDPASRTSYDPGELAQNDLWFPPVDIPLGFGQTGSPPVLVSVSGYSRWLAARMIPSRESPDLILGQWETICRLGAVPRALVWDNEGAVGAWRRGRPQLTAAFQAFRGLLGCGVILCRPRDPESKGLVERANGYLETSFLPGRSFACPADFNAQLTDWISLANGRFRRHLDAAPADRIGADKAAMMPLPPIDTAQLGWHKQIRLGRDHYVRIDSNDYSVHPAAVGRRVNVHADLERVRVRWAGTLVADHDRCWAARQTITDPAHRAAADQLRRDHRHITAVDGPASRTMGGAVQVEQRSLDVYDALLADEPAGLPDPDPHGGQVA
jgi:transposase